MKLSIIVPLYNESSIINKVIENIESVKYPIEYEIIIVIDGSTDKSYERVFIKKIRERDAHVRIFINRLNKGKGFSIRKGIRRSRGDIVIIQDADKEYDPHDIPRIIEPILKGEADAVYGSRFLKTKYPDGMAFPNWIANVFLTKLTDFLFGLQLTDMETCYKAFKAEIIKGVHLKANRFAFEPEVTAKMAKRRIAIKEFPINYCGRTSKEGKKIRAIDFFYAVFTLLYERLTKA